MKQIFRSFLLLGALLSLSTAHAASSVVGSVVKVQLMQNQAQYQTQMRTLHDLKLDLAGVNYGKKQADLVVNDEELKVLKAHGFNVINVKSMANITLDNQYYTPAKLEAALKKIAAQYPALTHLESVGKSGEGRDIWAIRITQNSTLTADKPSILFNGMHHAREVMSTEVPMDIIETLLANYNKDANITHWVNANQIWVMPMLNVDGNNLVWTQNHMWRKNAHGGYGVDINRNYPYAWASCNGSSDYTGAQDYHGPNAASEPETNVMMKFVERIRPKFDISFHSYSELVIYPYGCAGEKNPDHDILAKIGKEMADLIPGDHGGHYTAGVAPDLLYPVDGSDLDYMYHEFHVLPFVIELNSDSLGFQPSYKYRQPTVEKLRPAWQLLLKKMDESAFRK